MCVYVQGILCFWSFPILIKTSLPIHLCPDNLDEVSVWFAVRNRMEHYLVESEEDFNLIAIRLLLCFD